MQINLIWGPTCTGKTAIAIDLARKTGWGVVSLDRIQCYPQVSTGSGRPLQKELGSTRRIYLDERTLKSGVIDADEAERYLRNIVEQERKKGGVILEGGSISLLNAMFKDDYWGEDFSWHFHRTYIYNKNFFLLKARKRVVGMMKHVGERLSILEELVENWRDPANRQVIKDIDGYRFAISFSEKNNMEIEQLLRIPPEMRSLLINGIAEEYLEHAFCQERYFPTIPSSWNVADYNRIPLN